MRAGFDFKLKRSRPQKVVAVVANRDRYAYDGIRGIGGWHERLQKAVVGQPNVGCLRVGSLVEFYGPNRIMPQVTRVRHMITIID